jgi:hypothetical protein
MATAMKPKAGIDSSAKVSSKVLTSTALLLTRQKLEHHRPMRILEAARRMVKQYSPSDSAQLSLSPLALRKGVKAQC